MKIKDKSVGKMVNMLNKDCLRRKCYWARQDPGSFSQGTGYSHRSNDWLCGNREIHGCPRKKEFV